MILTVLAVTMMLALVGGVFYEVSGTLLEHGMFPPWGTGLRVVAWFLLAPACVLAAPFIVAYYLFSRSPEADPSAGDEEDEQGDERAQ